MTQEILRHQTCRHLVRQGDPRRGPIRPICFACSCLISGQAVDSIERRFFSVISQGDFVTSQRYLTSLEMAFALGRFEELELALREMALGCVFDHPTLFTSTDIDSLVIATIRVFLGDTTFEYAIDDARTFIRERSLVLGMEASSLRTRRRQSTASDSGSIQLPTLNGTDDSDFFDGEDLIAEIERMSID
jgi:hypothetical protein